MYYSFSAVSFASKGYGLLLIPSVGADGFVPNSLLASVLGLPLDATPILNSALSIAGALGILLVGWFVATIISGVIKGIFKRTKWDEGLASWMGNQFDARTFPLDAWAATLVFWGIMLFAIMGALNALNLPMVSGPIQGFLNSVMSYLPKVFGALALLGVAWLLATVAKTICTRGLDQFGLGDRLAALSGESASEAPLKSETLGDILYWGIFLLFLPMILGALDLEILGPVNNLVNTLLSALPNILQAVLIGVIGWFVAKLVGKIVANFLAAAGADRLGASLGMTDASGLTLSKLAGNGLFGFIVLVTTVEALQALKLPAISGPATAMLGQILAKLPAILTAVGILVGSYFIGKFIANLLTQLLTGVGFDRIPGMLGLPSNLGGTENEGASASSIAGTVALVGIMLTATVAALDALQMPQLSMIATAILAIASQVLVGVLVFGIGLYVANLAVSLIKQSGLKQANTLAQVARVAILAFVGAMALQRIGVAPDIVNLAFGLLLGSIAVAIALAFGLGGRDVAGDTLREWMDTFKK